MSWELGWTGLGSLPVTRRAGELEGPMINVLIVGEEDIITSRIPSLSSDQPSLEYQSFTSHLLISQHL